jgi:Arm DNA-binding domain
MRYTLQFGGLSVWHLDCGTALCQLTEAHRQQRVRVPRLSVTPNHLRKFRYCQVLTRRRIAFKYYDGRAYREPLGVEASKRTRVDAERLSSTIQLELSAGTFDYAKRFPNSGRVKALGLERPEQRSNQTLKEFAEAAWLPEKRLEVKRSTFVYYNEIYKPHIEKAEIGKKLLSEINDEDINLWKLEIEGKRTPQKKPLSTRRKNMSLDVLCQILRLAKRRGLANDKLLIDARPFKNEENADEVNPFTEDEVESLLKASDGWERSLLAVCFFTGMRRGEVPRTALVRSLL